MGPTKQISKKAYTLSSAGAQKLYPISELAGGGRFQLNTLGLVDEMVGRTPTKVTTRQPPEKGCQSEPRFDPFSRHKAAPFGNDIANKAKSIIQVDTVFGNADITDSPTQADGWILVEKKILPTEKRNTFIARFRTFKLIKGC